jgi:two-component system response regulator MprA
VSRLLIVDDDAAVAETFARMLRLEGYEVLTALDAEAALQQVEAARPDALILDLHMPLIDGTAFLRRLRSCEKLDRTPVAIVTGDYTVDEGTARDLHALGAELYFKPLWLADLVGIIRDLLDRTAQSS